MVIRFSHSGITLSVLALLLLAELLVLATGETPIDLLLNENLLKDTVLLNVISLETLAVRVVPLVLAALALDPALTVAIGHRVLGRVRVHLVAKVAEPFLVVQLQTVLAKVLLLPVRQLNQFVRLFLEMGRTSRIKTSFGPGLRCVDDCRLL